MRDKNLAFNFQSEFNMYREPKLLIYTLRHSRNIFNLRFFTSKKVGSHIDLHKWSSNPSKIVNFEQIYHNNLDVKPGDINDLLFSLPNL